MEMSCTFTSPLSYEECCTRLQALPDWQWRRGDSDVFGSHIKGHNQIGEIIELYFLEDYALELVSTDKISLEKLQQETLQLLEAALQ